MTTSYTIEGGTPINTALWERYVPTADNAVDWQAYTSFKGRRNDSLGKRIRMLNLAQLARQTYLPGIFAECGCFRGHSTHIIATMMRLTGRKDPLYVFDSFQGLSPVQPEDLTDDPRASSIQDALRAADQPLFAASLDDVKANLAEHSNIQYFPGWIPDRFAEVADKAFAFVHIDVDLYAPMRDCLAFFYPRLAKGGMIQIDDYNFIDWPGCNKAVNEFLADNPPTLFVQLPLGGAFLVK